MRKNRDKIRMKKKGKMKDGKKPNRKRNKMLSQKTKRGEKKL
jgi:hypothetical protein